MGIRTAPAELPAGDVVLVGAGIMSATLASMLRVLEPDWSVVVLEAADQIAGESTDPWNNAGTGHSGFCELNYMPDPADGSKPASIAEQFLLTRQWWASLAAAGAVEPDAFIRTSPHMSVVFGYADSDYLRRRHSTLRGNPLFRELEFTDDPAVLAEWAPLVTDGRPLGPVAATRHPRGTDVDFGALASQLLEASGAWVLLEHVVHRIRRTTDAGVVVTGRRPSGRFRIRARHVFVGAGGQALRQLQRAGVDDVRRYGVLPVGAAFLRCDRPEVVARHDSKVYGQAPVGAPPMSVPHLDRRTVDGRDYLMFGPYATFSTRLLKRGRLTDFFTTLHPRNMWTVVSASATNRPLIRFLVSELLAGRRKRFSQLTQYFPDARDTDWTMISAGQRAQLVTPGPRSAGVLQQGTELIVSSDRQVSGLLGASPGASTAVPIMLEMLERTFPDEWSHSWATVMADAVPGLSVDQWTDEDVEQVTTDTARALRLA